MGVSLWPGEFRAKTHIFIYHKADVTTLKKRGYKTQLSLLFQSKNFLSSSPRAFIETKFKNWFRRYDGFDVTNMTLLRYVQTKVSDHITHQNNSPLNSKGEKR